MEDYFSPTMSSADALLKFKDLCKPIYRNALLGNKEANEELRKVQESYLKYKNLDQNDKWKNVEKRQELLVFEEYDLVAEPKLGLVLRLMKISPLDGLFSNDCGYSVPTNSKYLCSVALDDLVLKLPELRAVRCLELHTMNNPFFLVQLDQNILDVEYARSVSTTETVGSDPTRESRLPTETKKIEGNEDYSNRIEGRITYEGLELRMVYESMDSILCDNFDGGPIGQSCIIPEKDLKQILEKAAEGLGEMVETLLLKGSSAEDKSACSNES